MVANNSSGTRTFKYGSTVDYVKELEVVLPEQGKRTLKPIRVEDVDGGDTTIRRVADLITENWKLIQAEKPKVTKNSCGYRLERAYHDGILDLPKLFCGSEGTLGIITDTSLETPPKPRSRALMVVESSLSELDEVVAIFRAMKPSAVELVDKSVFREAGKEERLRTISRSEEQYLVFCELDGERKDSAGLALERAASSGISGFEPLAMTDPGEVAAAWSVRNETLTLATDLRRGSRSLLPGVEDLVVPTERLKDLISLLTDQFESRGLGYISYGHAGDANLHMRPFLDPSSRKEMSILEEIMEESFEAVWGMGGSISGEHGDGMLRARFVQRQYPRTHELMKEIRRLFDPKSLLNPGVKIS
jgi:FAD/FMN-containing dehydrogenase